MRARHNEGRARLFLVDARSKVAAQGNRMMGKGTELVKNYDACELVYMNIGNIHALRDAFEDVVKLCQPWALHDSSTWPMSSLVFMNLSSSAPVQLLTPRLSK